MTPSGNDPRDLETVVHRALRELPLRRAPHSLEQRVLAEIERRAALPWWRMSFVHWPLVAQAGFVLICAALVTFALTGRGWVMAGVAAAEFKSAFAQPLSWLESVVAVVHAITSFCSILLRNIPAVWLYGGIVFFGSMYAALFGLGAAVIKALRVHHAPSEPSPV